MFAIFILTLFLTDFVKIFAANANLLNTFTLNMKDHGIEGSIEVIASINAGMAQLRILNKNRKEISSDKIHGRNARLEKVDTADTSSSFYLITTDQFAGFGSYSGLVTKIFQVKHGQLNWSQITLMKSLKSSWQLKRLSKNFEIYEVSCFPDLEKSTDSEAKFETTLTHYVYSQDRWISRSKKRDGCWEEGDKFPDARLFL